MRRYPEYKASGVKWIGEIPKDWEVKKIKYTQSHLIGGVWGKEPEGNENDIYCIRVADFNYVQLAISTRNLTLRNIPLKERDKRILSTDDLLLEKSGGGEKSPVGRTVIFDAGIPRRSVTSNFISKFTAKSDSCFPKYLLYCLSFLYHIGLTRKHIKQSTGLQNLDIDSYFQERIPFSSLTEQTQIANFLDRKTGQIDELIRIKERRIELLQEQRTTLINQAVTKGLDPNAEMKPSEVEWIGEIPKHWTITRLKYLGESIIGLSYKPEDVTDDKNGTLVLRASNIQNGKPSFLDNVYVNAEVDEKLYLKEDDILICSRSGSRELIGKNITITKELEGVTFGVFMTIFRTKFFRFISCFLNSQVFKNQSGLFLTSTINQLTINTLNNFLISFPTDEREQAQIADFLNRKTQHIDELISTEQRKIELLKEYRQSLISEVVTGKIDVRNEV